jgi:hypothetical protein
MALSARLYVADALCPFAYRWILTYRSWTYRSLDLSFLDLSLLDLSDLFLLSSLPLSPEDLLDSDLFIIRLRLTIFIVARFIALGLATGATIFN